MEFGTKIFFFSFSAYLIPFWLGIMPENGFLVFWIFLLFFSEFSCRCSIWAEFGPKIFFSLSRLISYRFGKKYYLMVVFQFFEFFCYFFRNFLAGPEYERNSGLKFFSPFLCLSHPVLVKNNAGKWFLKFFAIFFWIFLTGSSMNGIRD